MNRYRLRHVDRFLAVVYGFTFIWALATVSILGYQEGEHEKKTEVRQDRSKTGYSLHDKGPAKLPKPGRDKKPVPQSAGSRKATTPGDGVKASTTNILATVKRYHEYTSRGGTTLYYTSEVTGYTARDKGMDGRGITKTETRAKAGRTCAADFDIFPPGTVLDIEGIGVRIVEDIGSAINNYDLDVFTDTKAEAYKIGRSKRKVRVISWGVR